MIAYNVIITSKESTIVIKQVVQKHMAAVQQAASAAALFFMQHARARPLYLTRWVSMAHSLVETQQLG
jgi:hypothetical protein